MTISGCFNSENETLVPGVSVAGDEVSNRWVKSAISSRWNLTNSDSEVHLGK